MFATGVRYETERTDCGLSLLCCQLFATRASDNSLDAPRDSEITFAPEAEGRDTRFSGKFARRIWDSRSREDFESRSSIRTGEF